MTLPTSIQAFPRLGQWLALDTPGRLTVFTGKVELGQGLLAMLGRIAADALSLRTEQVDVVSGDTRRVPDEWYTAGSQSTENAWAVLRPLCLHLRCLLLEAAAGRLGVRAAQLTLADGEVHHGNAATGLSVWRLAPEVAWGERIHALKQPLVEPAPRWVGGRSPRHDLLERITGAGFIHDLVFDDMLHARIVRAGGACDEAVRAQRFPQVRVLRAGGLVAVLSRREEEAVAAAASSRLFPALAAERPMEASLTPDDLPSAASVAHVVLAQDEPQPGGTEHTACYQRGFLAHASIGPCCALARLDPASGELTVWTHSQGVFALRDQIARVLAARRGVRAVQAIHQPGAGCYGHNGADDAALEASLLALQVPGQTVRLLWSRAEEFQQAPAGSAMRIALGARLLGGRIVAWHSTLWSGSHGQRPGWTGRVNLPAACHAGLPDEGPPAQDVAPAAGGGGDRNAVPLYAFDGQRITYHYLPQLPVRTSSLRTLGAHANVFAIEGFMDELAQAAGCDPLAFRLRHLQDERARNVLLRVVQMANWQPATGTDIWRGQGLAVARYKNKAAWMAAVVEVEMAEDLRVTAVWCAVDCGRAVDPDGVANQVEGGVVQALSWSLRESLEVMRSGRILSATWEDYPILGFHEIPRIHVACVASDDPPLGVGEVAAGPVAAALGNAVAAACGVRIRQLPITRDRLMAALL